MRVKQGGAADGQRFEIVRPLGSGGFGNVSEAFDRLSAERVALKELTRVNPSALFRFKQEFRALADIHHANLVRLRELFEQAGRWYIVMDLVEGSELLSFVRPSANDGGPHEARLRQAFSGVAEGLEALHAHGVMHRDLKPSNVIVTPEGHAVLLDFGLATSVDSRGQSTHAAGVGTVLYMSPEQIDGQKLGRASDWYAFGTTLYEALTGTTPFTGESALRIAMDKLRTTPPGPSALAAGLPRDLSELAMQLLEVDPQRRPRGHEVLNVLRGEAARHTLQISPSPSLAPSRLFAGREAELDHLERALARTHQGELRIVLVEGESGVGKSELVAEFLRQQGRSDARTLALRGRCYENEQVSYKAFDGCIDELARQLRRMGGEALPLMPVQAQLLAQLFPVLADVRALVQARSGNVAADPIARRLQAFAALSGLLANLAEERPLIVVVDDLQWADGESFRLLRALVEGPSCPPILIIATVRPRDELEGEVRASLKAVREWSCTDTLALHGLPHAQAEALARSLLGDHHDPSWASAIARESRGHPLFLAELIHFTQSRDLRSHGALSLEAALAARIERLDRNARALLEMVALAARPHSAGVFARALELPRVDGGISALLAHKLLRTRRDQEIGCFHDRIRHAAVALIPDARLPHLHRCLARALAGDPAIDPTEEATHWDLAGERERALDAYARAAKQAFEALAFGRAVDLYGRALELCAGAAHPEYARFTSERAHALACAGRSAEAADLYQRAADLATSDEQRLRLRSRTALQLMLSGKLQKGLDASRELFAQLGVTIPKSDWAALALSFWHRLRTRFRRDVLLAPGRADANQKLVLDFIQEQVPVFASTRVSAYLAVSAQYTRLALAYGDLAHVSAAYASEGWLRNARSGPKAAAVWFELARALGRRVANDAKLQATLTYAEGSARLANLEWSEGAELLQSAHDLYQAHLSDQPWQLTHVRHMLGTAWFRMGEHAHLALKMDEWIQEARERKDRLGLALLVGMGYGCLRHLMRGRAEDAEAELTESMAPLADEPFSFAHFGQLLVIPLVHGARSGRAAWDWFEQRRSQHDSVLLLKTRFGREGVLVMRCNAALMACASTNGGSRSVFLESAERDIRALKASASPLSASTAEVLGAQVAIARGELDAGLERVRRARAGYERANYRLPWVSYLEGKLEGGEAGHARCRDVLAFYEAQDWSRPEDAIAIFAPAAALLGEGRARASRHESHTIRHYAVLGSLGRGGFGQVVEARDTRSGELVALKELVSKSARALARFKQEFRALRDLNHPNVVRLQALFEEDGRRYIAMELVRGQELLGYVRPEGKLDGARLRRAFTGLVAGARALHEAGLVHRDISSENVVVGAEGRAVLLDFGLLAREHDASDSGPLGNPRYAAPEQLDGAAPDRAADAYALGVCLYQALSGEPPIAVTTGDAIETNQKTRPELPRVPDELASLAALSLRLLAPDPAQRPSLRELAALLANPDAESGAQGRRPSLALSNPAPEVAAFRGREKQLAQLAEARTTAERGFALVLVEGESGLGKSALVSEFVRLEQARAPAQCCLAGRCYENEQLAFKAFDGVVDELARYLRGLPQRECAALLPKKSALLSQLFPVLGSVPAIAEAPHKGLPADPRARRADALLVFIELLERLAQTRPLLLTVDDLQWADADSVALISALAARAQALPLMLVATLRPAHEVPASLELGPLKNAPSTCTIVLGGLSAGDARALARSLTDMEVPDGLLEGLADECQGHPLFLRQLIELTKTRGASFSSGSFTLDAAFAARIGRFSHAQRRLLGLVALAGKPYPGHVFGAASGEREEDLRASVDELLNQHLLRRRGDTSFACYHDRVRHVALELLSVAERRQLSEQLARALDQHEAQECAERARLWDQAEQRDQALVAHEQAGDAALAKLAFAQAERHYARALELTGEARDERWQRLTVQRAHALSRGGHAARAAQLYKVASESAQGELAVRLRVWAAQHLIHSAQVDEGLAAASTLVVELGQKLHLNDAAALASIAWDRLCIGARGIAVKPRRQAKGAAERERILMDTMLELGLPVNWVSFLGGTALSLSHLRRALRSGDPEYAAQALATEGMVRASLWRRDWTECFDRARDLLRTVDNPRTLAFVEYVHGVAFLTACDFAQGERCFATAHRIVEEQCQSQRFLLTQLRAQLGTAWWWLGRHRELATNMQIWIDEAKDLHDHYALSALCGSGCGSLRWLMTDQPEQALAELESALAPWPRERFSWGQWGALYCTFAIHLYLGGSSGHAWFQPQKAFLSKQPIIKADFSRPVMEVHEAMHALHAIERPHGAETRALIARAEPLVARQRRQRSPWFRAGGEEGLAIIRALRGERAAALEHARAACKEYATAPVGDYWKRGEYLLARLEGGNEGNARCRAVHAFLAGEGWRNAERMLAMYLPCLQLLD